MAKVIEEVQGSFAGAERRGKLVGLTGLLIQLGLFVVVLVAAVWSGVESDAVLASARHLAGGLLIWLILAVVFAQRQRSRVEDLDTEQLRRAQQKGLATSIFDVGDEAMLLHRRRLNWTIRFLVPVFTVLTAVYLIGGTFAWWRWPLGAGLADDHAWRRTKDPFVLMLLMAGVGVVSFAYARYVVGMSRHAPWRLLRAGGSYLLGCSLTAVVVAAAMAMARVETTRLWAEPVAAYAIRVGMLLLGVEILLNFILDFYRPRRTGEDIRPAFDSRVLALLGEPGGVVRSIAETINYQFGFEVSSTWFYKLVQRSVFPLVVLTAVVLMLLTSVVVVDVDERAYIERFGRQVASAGGEPLGPGLHFKWFWP
ncbi:MAG: hypothetical protein HOP29_11805, partial [Phycisphaerales bacterium]|nr:hypothetical protein [Phycisphaerales bacterium]